MNVCSLLPLFVHENFPVLNNLDVGILMAVYPIGFLIAAPFIGKWIQVIGRKNSVVIGIVIATVSTLMLGMGGYCKHAKAFMAISFVARMF